MTGALRRGAAVAASIAATLAGAAPVAPAVADPVAAATTTAATTAAAPVTAAPVLPPGWPVTVTIQTVPAVRGVKLLFDGKPLWTSSTGRASYTATHDFGSHTLTLVSTQLSTQERRYHFVRWAGQRDPDQAFRPTVRGLPMRTNYTVTLAFSVEVAVKARLVDQFGWPIDPGTVSAVTVKSDSGRLVDLPVNTSTWVEAATPFYRKSVLGISDVSYSLHRVAIAGTNAVDGVVQKFSPVDSSTVTFTVGLHDLTIFAHDAMWGSRVGDAALVKGPDGGTRTVLFGTDGVAKLAGLPPGKYRVDVRKPGGVVFTREVSLFADRTIDVPVARWLDVALLAASAVGLALLLLLAGRVRWRRSVAAAHRLLPPLVERETLAS